MIYIGLVDGYTIIKLFECYFRLVINYKAVKKVSDWNRNVTLLAYVRLDLFLEIRG